MGWLLVLQRTEDEQNSARAQGQLRPPEARYRLTRRRAQSSVKNVFIRGSVVRYVHLPASSVDTALLEDATRRGMGPSTKAWAGAMLMNLDAMQKRHKHRQKRSRAEYELMSTDARIHGENLTTGKEPRSREVYRRAGMFVKGQRYPRDRRMKGSELAAKSQSDSAVLNGHDTCSRPGVRRCCPRGGT